MHIVCTDVIHIYTTLLYRCSIYPMYPIDILESVATVYRQFFFHVWFSVFLNALLSTLFSPFDNVEASIRNVTIFHLDRISNSIKSNRMQPDSCFLKKYFDVLNFFLDHYRYIVRMLRNKIEGISNLNSIS